MEPTGIEPVTSCLQSGVANPWNRPAFQCLWASVAPMRRGRYGWIGHDPAGFGQRNRAAAQTPRSAPRDPRRASAHSLSNEPGEVIVDPGLARSPVAALAISFAGERERGSLDLVASCA